MQQVKSARRYIHKQFTGNVFSLLLLLIKQNRLRFKRLRKIHTHKKKQTPGRLICRKLLQLVDEMLRFDE